MWEMENNIQRIGTSLSIRNTCLVGRRHQRTTQHMYIAFRAGCGHGINWNGNNPAKLQGIVGAYTGKDGWSRPHRGRGEASVSRRGPVIIQDSLEALSI